MEQQIYDKINLQCGQYSSWAIWYDDQAKFFDTSIISESIEVLHSKFVIVGFNASRILDGHWNNYHMLHQGGRDKWLAELFNKEPYQGAYMTDLLKTDTADETLKLANSEEVETHFFQPDTADKLSKSREQKNFFKTELELIGANDETVFVLFGELTSRYFDCFTDFRFSKKCHLPHYAGRASKEEWLNKCELLLNEFSK